MGGPTVHEFEEGEDFLDSLTRDQLEQAAEDYDENKQRIDVAPTTKQLLGPFTITCMVLNRTIGSGVFTVPPKVLAGTGSVGGALLLWAAGGSGRALSHGFVFSLLARVTLYLYRLEISTTISSIVSLLTPPRALEYAQLLNESLGLIVLAGTLCWLELGLSIPFHKIKTDDGDVRKVSAPRSGGEKNFLEFIFKRPKMLMTCMYGIQFLILGNISGNAVAFGIYVAIAAGKDPIYDSNNNYSKGLVIGLAMMTLTLCAGIHIFSRRGGVLLNNFFAVIKVSMVFVLAILGFVHAGGKYLQASGINEPAIPHLEIGNFQINDTMINSATETNFNNAFATNRHDVASYVDSFLFVLFSYTGFEQPFYVLSEVRRPRKFFPPAVLIGMTLATVLYVLVNVAYLCVVPKEVYTTSPSNALNMAGTFLHYLFDDSVGPRTAERVMAALIAVSIFGNVIVMTFTAARVKQEIAKEGILPYSLFFATGHTTPLAWLKSRLSRSPYPRHSQVANTVNLEDHLEKSPMAALALHWVTSIILVLVTIPLKPSTQYSFLTALYSYVNLNVIGMLVSGGLLYLKIDSFFRGDKGRDWNSKVNYMPWISPIHAIVYFLATTFFLFASFVPPAGGSAYSASVQGYAWFIVPTIGMSSLLWGGAWWLGLRGVEWSRRRTLVVSRTPYIERDEDGGYVQKAELVEHDWLTETKHDYESGHS